MAEIKSESVADFIPEWVADFPRNMHAAASFIVHDCDATRGTSGGALLVRQGGGRDVIGIIIGAAPEANVALPAIAAVNYDRRPHRARPQGLQPRTHLRQK